MPQQQPNPASFLASNHPVQGAVFPILSQNITISSSSAINAGAFSHAIIRVVSDVDCYIIFGGSNATAVAGNTLLPAGAIEYFNCQGNTNIAVISKTGNTGILNVTEMS